MSDFLKLHNHTIISWSGAWNQETRDKRQESRAWCLELGAWGLGHGIKRQETRDKNQGSGAWSLGRGAWDQETRDKRQGRELGAWGFEF
jgi:hypothetical protein